MIKLYETSDGFSAAFSMSLNHCRALSMLPASAWLSIIALHDIPSEGKTRGVIYKGGGKDNFYVACFALELKLSKTLSGLVHFVWKL